MVRTQIQLSENQVEALKKLATRTGVSVDELVRQSVDQLVTAEHEVNSAERKQRALRAVGKFASGCHDVSTEHDQHLSAALHR